MSKLQGQLRDMGDVVIHTEWLVKGRHWKVVFHIGPHITIIPSQRPAPVPATHISDPERIDLIMDLAADKKVPLSVQFTDELEHPVATPPGTTVTWSVDDTTIISLIDEDVLAGTIWAAAVGALGNAVVSMVATLPTGPQITGDLLLSVVPGEAERATVVAGTPEEVTPD